MDERVTSFWRCPEIRGANGGEHGYDSRRRVSRAVAVAHPRSCATALKSRTPWKHGQRFLGLERVGQPTSFTFLLNWVNAQNQPPHK